MVDDHVGGVANLGTGSTHSQVGEIASLGRGSGLSRRNGQARMRDRAMPPKTKYRKKKLKRGMPAPRLMSGGRAVPDGVNDPAVVLQGQIPVSQEQPLSPSAQSGATSKVRKVRRVPKSQSAKYQKAPNTGPTAASPATAMRKSALSGASIITTTTTTITTSTLKPSNTPPGTAQVRNDLAGIMQQRQQQIQSSGGVVVTSPGQSTAEIKTQPQTQIQSVRKVRRVLRAEQPLSPKATGARPTSASAVDVSLKKIIAEKAAKIYKKKEKKIQRAIRKLDNEPEPPHQAGDGCACIIL